jgi:hypothetical protein
MGPIIRKIRVLGSDRKSEMAGACLWPGFEEGVVSDTTVSPSNVYAIGTICARLEIQSDYRFDENQTPKRLLSAL